MHPWTFRPTRRWPLDRFIELAGRLRAEGVHPVVTVAPNDPASIRARASASGVPVYESRTPQEAHAFFGAVDALVAGDTGTSHIGAAAGCPIVALVGPSDLEETAPWKASVTTLRHYVDCAPCFHYECPQSEHCMEMIRVDEVAAAVRSVTA